RTSGDRTPAISAGACETGWAVRVHSVWMLHVPVPVLVVEPESVPGSGSTAADTAFSAGQSRSGKNRAPGKSARSLQSVPLPKHRKLFLGVPEGSQPNGCNWKNPSGIDEGRDLIPVLSAFSASWYTWHDRRGPAVF